MFAYVAKGAAALLVLLALFVAYFVADYLLFQKHAYEDALGKINHMHGVETCQSIPPTTYETFLLFNPSNLQTYYFRSSCFQELAVQTRAENLCDQVKERKSIFFNGSGVSPTACRKAVADIRNKDFAERVRPESVHKIESIKIDSAPSGDIEVRFVPAGTLWGTYRFTISLIDPSGAELGNLYDLETHLSDRRDPLFASLQRRKIQALTDGRNACGKIFALRIDLKLLRDDHGQLQRSNLSANQLESTATQSLPLKVTEPADCP
jgi:hypothetical protein